MIGRDTIDRIRSRVDIVAVVGESVKLTRRGRNFVGLCPFHKEKSPSFNVSADRQMFHCFGCKVTGDVFKFVELQEGSSFVEAVRKLAERAGVEIVDERGEHDRQAEQRARKAKDDLYAINAMAAAFFEKMLREHPLAPIAHEELERRGLAYEGPLNEVLSAFGIGYAPHGWDALATHLRTQGVSPAQAEQVGLLAPRSSGSGYYDAFRHRLMVAIKDVQGRVVAFSGRVLPDPPNAPSDPSKGAPPKYVNSRESPIYAKGATLFGLFQARNAIRTKGEAVIVEGNFDLVAMHARGIDHAVAPLGTAFTPDQARLLRRFAPSVVLLFDADAAGRKATWAARETCKEVELSARAARLPSGKDPDEFLRARGADAMKAVLERAAALDEVLIDDVCEPVGAGANLAAKQAALQKIRPILESQDLAFREVLAKRAAVRLGLDQPSVWRLVRGAAERTSGGADDDYGNESSSQLARAVPARTSERGNDRGTEEDRLSRAIVEALLACPELLDEPDVQDSLSLVTGEWAFAVVALREEMRASCRENRPIDAASLLARLPPSIQEFAAAKLVDPSLDPADGDAHSGKESAARETDGRPDPLIVRRVVRANGLRLARAQATARYREIEVEVARAEAEGDIDRALARAAEKTRLFREMQEAARAAAAAEGH